MRENDDYGLLSSSGNAATIINDNYLLHKSLQNLIEYLLPKFSSEL